jgi:DNA polymerase elongation subunit (family B)
LDLTSLYPSIIMTINISPETKMGKIEDWSAEDLLKIKEIVGIINGDTITQENLKKFFERSNSQLHPMVYLYRTDKVGCIPDILDLWFHKG